jgi:hypothetical protein
MKDLVMLQGNNFDHAGKCIDVAMNFDGMTDLTMTSELLSVVQRSRDHAATL